MIYKCICSSKWIFLAMVFYNVFIFYSNEALNRLKDKAVLYECQSSLAYFRASKISCFVTHFWREGISSLPTKKNCHQPPKYCHNRNTLCWYVIFWPWLVIPGFFLQEKLANCVFLSGKGTIIMVMSTFTVSTDISLLFKSPNLFVTVYPLSAPSFTVWSLYQSVQFLYNNHVLCILLKMAKITVDYDYFYPSVL